MAWNGLNLTVNGRNALSHAQVSGEMSIKSIVIGDGNAPDNFNTQEGLVHQLYEIEELKIDVKEDGCELTADFPKVTNDYYFREIGVIVTSKGKDILYVYDNCGSDAQLIVNSDAEATEKRVRLFLKISNVQNITVQTPSILYVSYDEFEKVAEHLTDHINNTDNPHQVTKWHVGLGNVDNTADSEKPVSKEQQRVIDEKYSQANNYTNEKIAQLINGAPETLNTLKEVADAIAQNKSVVDALNSAIGTKADIGHSHAWGSLPGTPSTFPPAPHGHDYLPLSGGTVTGNFAVTGNLSSDRYYTATPDKTMVIESGGFVNIQVGQSAQVRTYGDAGWAAISAREFVQQSSAKYKENIEEMTEEYAKKLLELRPVSYDYKNKADGVGCYGLIAEEVDAVESYPVYYNDDHEPEGIDYSKFVPQIIKLLQMHEKELEKLKENREIRA